MTKRKIQDAIDTAWKGADEAPPPRDLSYLFKRPAWAIITWRRFLKKYRVREDGCWEWTGYRNSLGYGEHGSRTMKRAHRYSYLVHVGDIPKDKEVCHSCDRPWCVNPAHLWLGTRKENAMDCSRKGRLFAQRHPELLPRGDRSGARRKPWTIRRGERANNARHTWAAVTNMRMLRALGATTTGIAEWFDSNCGDVSRILRFKLWKVAA